MHVGIRPTVHADRIVIFHWGTDGVGICLWLMPAYGFTGSLMVISINTQWFAVRECRAPSGLPKMSAFARRYMQIEKLFVIGAKAYDGILLRLMPTYGWDGQLHFPRVFISNGLRWQVGVRLCRTPIRDCGHVGIRLTLHFDRKVFHHGQMMMLGFAFGFH